MGTMVAGRVGARAGYGGPRNPSSKVRDAGRGHFRNPGFKDKEEVMLAWRVGGEQRLHGHGPFSP